MTVWSTRPCRGHQTLRYGPFGPGAPEVCSVCWLYRNADDGPDPYALLVAHAASGWHRLRSEPTLTRTAAVPRLHHQRKKCAFRRQAKALRNLESRMAARAAARPLCRVHGRDLDQWPDAERSHLTDAITSCRRPEGCLSGLAILVLRDGVKHR